LPTLLSGISTLLVILILFRKDLKKPLENIDLEPIKLKNKPLVIINLTILGLTTIFLVISNYIHLEMWLICLTSLIILTIFLAIFSIKEHNKKYVLNTYGRLPYDLIPFIISMFILVLALKENGIILHISNILDKMSMNNISEGFAYGITSTLFDNIINNIPMSVLFTSVLEGKSELALFSTIAGSNIGAYLTPVGALAGIMWMSILKSHDIKYTFIDFMKYGLILVPVSLTATIIGLLILF
jgi:arsenical pump membrane protein